jgi:competence protein ComEA
MNPFLDDPVAKPLASRPVGSWHFPFSAHQQRLRLGRQAGALAIAAGVGAGFGVTTSAYAIDVNTASPSQLQAVKGVGPRTAQIIVQERIRAGHFESLEDLSDRVRGIGVKKLQAMQAGGLKVGNSGLDNALLISAEAGISNKKTKAQTNTVATPLIFPEP